MQVRTLNKVVLFSKEYPPYVYGGAGVHVEYLSRALARQIKVEVRCFGDQETTAANPAVRRYAEWPEAKEHTDPRFAGAVDAFARSLAMAKDQLDAEANRELFEEQLQLLLKCFNEEAFHHKGKYYCCAANKMRTARQSG